MHLAREVDGAPAELAAAGKAGAKLLPAAPSPASYWTKERLTAAA